MTYNRFIGNAPILIPLLIVAALVFVTWYRPAAQIRAYIKDPRTFRYGNMPAQPQLREQDLDALHAFKPDLAIGTTPVVQAAKELTVPALYFTNLISARPLMGPAGAGSLAQVINAAIANKGRFEAMREFFGDVGGGDQAGVWEGKPVMRPEFRAETRRQVIKMIKRRKAEEMV